MSDTDQTSFTQTEILQGIGREVRAANERLDTIKTCLIFFVVVTLVGWLAVVAAALTSAD